MAAPLVAEVKEALRGIDLAEAREAALGALDRDDPDAVRAVVAPLLDAAPAR
jgi:signal transduction protein with GAF and PtsI domain